MTAAPLRVRDATLADAEQIAAVHVDSWRETYSTMLPSRVLDGNTLARREHMWRAILAAQPVLGATAVVVDEEKIVGFAFAAGSGHPDARRNAAPVRDLHLFSLYVLEDAHRRGAGTALLERVLGTGPAQLWVLRENTGARRFYERRGFAEDGVTFTDPDLDGAVELRMVR
ncbi:GNAT family N-acetyltransferase [Microbacterium gilvum]|uniref:GNAT family N-acetyltransferase n=1 Tax=Microbacterium gilvum TaxID=1336204 RepID=A0ABP8ZSK0_9MICO